MFIAVAYVTLMGVITLLLATSCRIINIVVDYYVNKVHRWKTTKNTKTVVLSLACFWNTVLSFSESYFLSNILKVSSQCYDDSG